jgi:hypothetical protein
MVEKLRAARERSKHWMNSAVLTLAAVAVVLGPDGWHWR